MPPRSTAVLTPRKSPVQARSAASVDAILDATIQVLVAAGKERLTTTRVAARAGVSIGTLYQYFPNKSALLRAALKRHLEQIAGAVERACHEQKGNGVQDMAAAVITAFLRAKMRNGKTSVALYSASSDVDGARIAKQIEKRVNRAVVEMLETARRPITRDVGLVASMLQSVLGGISRRLLECDDPERQFDALHEEVIFVMRVYLEACTS